MIDHTMRPFLTAEWRDLVMLNYEIDPSSLAPYVPVGTIVDQWEGRTFVSLVGFRFLDTRVLGLPIPGHRNFDEINLRFYVRAPDGDLPRRGVVFVCEIVPRLAVATVARVVYGEHYVARRMRSVVHPPREGAGVAKYEWWEGRWYGIAAKFQGEPALPVPGSLEAFIAEHYWGYTARGRRTIAYRVEHPAWRLWPARAMLGEAVGEYYGPPFDRVLRGAPHSAFVAEGSPVTVFRGTRLRRDQ